MALEQNFLDKILKTAIDAARLAAAQAIKELEHIEISIKNKTDLVTQADTKCQEIIIDRIKQDFPAHGFIAEEGQAGQLFKLSPQPDQPFWWVIDPIDGTNNFAHNMPIFTVSIAVMHQGQPIAGVIFDPCTDSLYSAVKGANAECNGQIITVNDNVINRFASIGLDTHFDGNIPAWASQIILNTRFRTLGTTALHFAYVARGSFIAAVTPRTKLWDIAAGACIAQSAGATITDFKGDDVFPMDLENYQGQNLKIIAANKKVHFELLKLINS